MSSTTLAEKPPVEKVISLIDSDVHNYPDSIADLLPYLPARWQVYIRQSGFTNPSVSQYPKVFSQAARRDAWPPAANAPAATRFSPGNNCSTPGTSTAPSSIRSTACVRSTTWTWATR